MHFCNEHERGTRVRPPQQAPRPSELQSRENHRGASVRVPNLDHGTSASTPFALWRWHTLLTEQLHVCQQRVHLRTLFALHPPDDLRHLLEESPLIPRH